MTERPVTVYTPESPLRQPTRFAREMMADLLASRELARRMFIRDLSAQYRNSLLGYLWIFVPPVLASLPFIYLNRAGLLRLGDTSVPYAAYAIVGTTIWQTFVDALNSPLKTANAARPILTRINFPREAILLSGLYDLTSMQPGGPEKAYFGEDASKYAERSSLQGLVAAPIPLLVANAELDPPDFQQQAKQLNDALCKAGRCPRFLPLAKHSHMSEAYAINTTDTSLSGEILAFVKGEK